MQLGGALNMQSRLACSTSRVWWAAAQGGSPWDGGMLSMQCIVRGALHAGHVQPSLSRSPPGSCHLKDSGQAEGGEGAREGARLRVEKGPGK